MERAPDVKKHLIYTLSDPVTHEVRYVGQSREWLSRPYEHFVCRGKSEKDEWIRSLKDSNLLPEINIIEQFDSGDDLDTREDYWIIHFYELGCPLLNLRLEKGKGKYIRPMPKYHRESISKSRKGWKDSEETREKKSRAVSGSRNPMSNGHTEESKKKMRDSWVRRKAKAANV